VSDIQPKKVKLPDGAEPFQGTSVTIENKERRVTIWLEIYEKTYRVRKTVEMKGKDRH
jgi:hypothetical protein